MQLILINGPNLNLLGLREPEQYGTTSFSALITQLRRHAKQAGAELVSFQSNSEGGLVDFIHKLALPAAQAARPQKRGLIVNLGAYSHTSIAILDAFRAVGVGENFPLVEVHLTNIYKRESFRHHSYLSDLAVGGIFGLGEFGYAAALDFLVKKLLQV